MKKGIKLGLVFLWMLIIFLFSNQAGQESSNISNRFSELVIHFIEKITNQTVDQNTVHYIIRKCAHITCYFILALLLFIYFCETPLSLMRIIFCSLLICIFYSIFDEIHQSFVANRNASVFDVCIDTLGSSTCLLLSSFIEKRRCSK